MSNKEFIEKIAREQGIPKYKAKFALKTIIKGLESIFRNNERVDIRGLGTFQMKEVASRERRNPANGDTHMEDTYLKPHFTHIRRMRIKIKEEK